MSLCGQRINIAHKMGDVDFLGAKIWRILGENKVAKRNRICYYCVGVNFYGSNGGENAVVLFLAFVMMISRMCF